MKAEYQRRDEGGFSKNDERGVLWNEYLQVQLQPQRIKQAMDSVFGGRVDCDLGNPHFPRHAGYGNNAPTRNTERCHEAMSEVDVTEQVNCEYGTQLGNGSGEKRAKIWFDVVQHQHIYLAGRWEKGSVRVPMASGGCG